MNYRPFNLRKVINASGRMSILGVSTLSEEVLQGIRHGGKRYYLMEELQEEAGRFLASYLKTEAAFVTNSASSGIALSVAGCITRGNQRFERNLFQEDIQSRDILLMKGHNIDYGAPIEMMVSLGGGIVKEAGFANGCTIEDLEAAYHEDMKAMLFVKSHHTVQKNMPSVEVVYNWCQEKSLPLILDAAAEEDITAYSNLADLIIFSGSKALEGPTTGIVAGKKKYIHYVKAHQHGIGRAMKVGKEAIFGLLEAVNQYKKDPLSKEEQQTLLQSLFSLEDLLGISVTLFQDEAGREIYRARISIDERKSPLSAKQIVDALKAGDPAIFTRDYHANVGSFDIDPRPLLPGDAKEIEKRIRKLFD